MPTMHKSAATLLGAILLMSGCGGGGGGGSGSGSDAPPPVALFSGSEVPLSATQSAAGATAFVAQQLVASSDSADPLVLGNAVPATDDSAEPSEV
jgi:hypothetical protein